VSLLPQTFWNKVSRTLRAKASDDITSQHSEPHSVCSDHRSIDTTRRVCVSLIERCGTGLVLLSSSSSLKHGMYLKQDAGKPEAGPSPAGQGAGSQHHYIYQSVMTALNLSNFLRHSRSRSRHIPTHMWVSIILQHYHHVHVYELCLWLWSMPTIIMSMLMAMPWTDMKWYG